jgi:hypothetical protein
MGANGRNLQAIYKESEVKNKPSEPKNGILPVWSSDIFIDLKFFEEEEKNILLGVKKLNIRHQSPIRPY